MPPLAEPATSAPSDAPPPRRRGRRALLLTLGLVAAAGLAVEAVRQELGPFAPSQVVLADGARLEPVDCGFDPGPWSARARCARLHPSDGAPPVAVVILRAPPWRRRASPIVYLTGGPGEETGLGADDLDAWRDWHEALGHGGDLVLFDPRGTGASGPRLDCPELRRLTRRELTTAREPRATFPDEAAALRTCRDRLLNAGIDLRNYTTARSAQDVADLIAALGEGDANLYGVSYGTRLALVVLRDHPEHVRSVVLDSVYPPDVDGFATWPEVLDGALQRLLDGCEGDPACAAAHPDLAAQLTDLLARVRAAPLRFGVPDPEATDPERAPDLEVEIDDHRLVAVLFDALYRWERIGELPSRIARAQQEPEAALRPLVEDFVTSLLDPGSSDLAFDAVECQDGPPRPSRAAMLALSAARPRVERYVRDDWDLDPCRVLGLGPASPETTRAAQSDRPVLLLAGDYDPVTPVAWARHAASFLTHARLVVVPGMAHGVLDGDDCAAEITHAFLANPRAPLDTSCVGEAGGPRFDEARASTR